MEAIAASGTTLIVPNKAKSLAQFKFFKAVESGRAKKAGGLSPRKAAEMLGGQSPKGLPERLGPTGKPKKLTGQAKRPR